MGVTSSDEAFGFLFLAEKQLTERGWTSGDAPTPTELGEALIRALDAAMRWKCAATDDAEHEIVPQESKLMRHPEQEAAFTQDASHRARAFLVSCVENKDLPMAARQHAAALLLRATS
jgi:hypothetical protein